MASRSGSPEGFIPGSGGDSRGPAARQSRIVERGVAALGNVMLRQRLRYEKRGPMRFVSHRDLMRILRRSFAAGEIPVCFSQGFNPHPRFSFGPSLRTGWEGLDEYLDVLLESPVDDLAGRCNRFLPEGLRVLDTGVVGPAVPKIAADVAGARYEVLVERDDVLDRAPGDGIPGVDPPPNGGSRARMRESEPRGRRILDGLEDAIRGRFSRAEPVYSAPERADPPAPIVLEVECAAPADDAGGSVSIKYLSTMHGGRSLFPEDILTPFLGDPAKLRVPIGVVRQSLYVKRRGEFVSPMSRVAMETHA